MKSGGDIQQGIVTLPTIIYAENNPKNKLITALYKHKKLDSSQVEELINSITNSNAIPLSLEEAKKYTIQAINYLNKNNRDREKLKDYYNEPKVDNDLDHKESDLIKIHEAIKGLPQDQQVVLRLFYLEEYSLKEISEILDKSEGTVKSRLYHAREKLKTILKNRNHD